jgi:hypothetical protein
MFALTSETSMPSASHTTMPDMAMPASMPHRVPLPALAWAYVAYCFGYAVWSAHKLIVITRSTLDGAPRYHRPTPSLWHRPRVIHACHAVTGAAMAWMLLAML